MKSRSYRGLLGRLFLTVALAGFSAASWAQADRSQARSMVISRYGIVASEHPLASQAGAAILAKGGNAIEAAIAANAAMGVVAPMMCGMGGDLFAIVYEAKTGKIHGLNASGWAPTGLTLERMTAQGLQTMPLHTIDAVTVPGAVAGWDALLHQFGRLSLAELLAPAIELARDGFPVSELTAGAWKAGEEGLRRHTNTAAVFLPRGRAPEVGELFIEALREELQEYGELLALLEKQQELIVQRAAADIASSVDLVNAQVELIKEVRSRRGDRQRALAEHLQLSAQATLTELTQQVAAKYQPLVRALVEENNRLLRKVQHRTQQNHILLSHSLELLQRLINSLMRETAGAVYTMDKRVAKLPLAGKSLYEAFG